MIAQIKQMKHKNERIISAIFETFTLMQFLLWSTGISRTLSAQLQQYELLLQSQYNALWLHKAYVFNPTFSVSALLSLQSTEGYPASRKQKNYKTWNSTLHCHCSMC